MNEKKTLTSAQANQESEYYFPYHYLDLVPKFSYLYRTVQSYRKIVCELIAPYQGQTVLDAGCGDGRMCYDLKKKNLVVQGVDYSERAISFARVFCPGITFSFCDLIKSHPEKKFDIILLVEVLEHFEPHTTKNVLANLKACLNDDGKLIITVPSTKAKLIPKHYQHFTLESLKELIAEDFEVVLAIGHLRSGLKLSIYRMLLKGDYIFGPLRTRFSVVRFYYSLIERLLRSIETCPPEKAGRLIVVCKKRDKK